MRGDSGARLLALASWPGSRAPADPPREGRWEPAADVYTVGQSVIIKLELAGVRPEALELTAEGRLLRVRGERSPACPGQPCEYRQVEIGYGRFERRFEFPYSLADARLEAACQDGFLTITVERAETGPRRIAIRDAT